MSLEPEKILAGATYYGRTRGEKRRVVLKTTSLFGDFVYYESGTMVKDCPLSDFASWARGRAASE